MWMNRFDNSWSNCSELKIASGSERFPGNNQLLDHNSSQILQNGRHFSSSSQVYGRRNTVVQTRGAFCETNGRGYGSEYAAEDSTFVTTAAQSLVTDSFDVQVQPVVTTSAVPGTTDLSSLLTATTGIAGDWFSQTFHDSVITNLVRNFYSNEGMISRNDIVSIFREVEQDNIVNVNEFSDLRTLVTDGNLLNMPDYVQVLAAKVVGDSAANATYQGYALGDLQVGSSGGQLEALVSKWFFGADHPANIIPATTGSSARAIGYGWASGDLFGNDGKISLTDIQQGDLGDCYFLASLGATLVQHTAAIQNMFIDNGDGTFTVRLFPEYDGSVSRTPDYVTVDRYLPVNVYDANQGTWGEHFAHYDNQSVGLWVALAEKAYAQFAEEGYSQRNNSNLNGSGLGYVPNSYASIEGGSGFRAMPSLTGLPAGYLANFPVNGVDPSSYLGGIPSLQTIAAALSQGLAMTADTTGTSDTHIDPYTGIVMNHEYVVVGANLSNGTLTLYNPWGDSSAATGDSGGYKVIPYDTFASYDLASINVC